MESEIIFGFAERQIIKNQILIELSLTIFVRRRGGSNNLPSKIT
jgi:hypothetical protein